MSDHSTSAPSSDRKGGWRVFVNLLAALGVLLIGASAMALSYFAFYDRTVEAGVEDPFTYLYLGEFALLLLLAFMASYILRRGKRLHRVGVELLILFLIATGLLAVVEEMLPVAMDAQTESILFAAVPWVGLLLAAIVARWIDIELRVRRTAEPTSASTTTSPTAEAEDTGSSTPAAARDTSKNEVPDSDIGWLTNKMRPEGATGEEAAKPNAKDPTADAARATAPDSASASASATSSSRPTKRDSARTRRNTRTRGNAKAKNREEGPQEATSQDDDLATDTTTPMEPVAAEPPTESLESVTVRDGASSEEEPAPDTETATESTRDADTATETDETAAETAAESDETQERAAKSEPPSAEPQDDTPVQDPVQDEATTAARREKEQAARRLAEEVANAPDDTAASPEPDSGPTTTRPQRPSDESDSDTSETALPPLPRRTPGESAHQPRRLTPIPSPVASTTEEPSEEDFRASERQPSEPLDDIAQGLLALVDPVEEDLVPDPPQDDPTTDEGSAGAYDATVPIDDVPPPSTSAPTDSDDERGDPAPSGDETTTSRGESPPSGSVEIPPRPLVRRPRRGNIADFPPTQPPSGQVRSGPTPP